jgi:hypothetical protein
MPILTAPHDQVLLPPGTYPAVIADVALRDEDGRPYLLWVFEVRHGNRTALVRRPTSLHFGPKSTARAITEAALGRRIRPGESIDTNDLLGCRVRVTVGRAIRPDGREVNRIERVLPAEDDEVPF